jgi:histidyl-tRNA synthetase
MFSRFYLLCFSVTIFLKFYIPRPSPNNDSHPWHTLKNSGRKAVHNICPTRKDFVVRVAKKETIMHTKSRRVYLSLIKINHRRILDGLFAVAGVPQDKTRTISAAVDKLDKISWSDAKKEMVEEKALPEEVADFIGEYVKKSGQLRHMLATLKQDRVLSTNAEVQAGLADMELLVTYLEALGVADMVSFDLSLARGLDYYTSLIYEVLHTPSSQRIDMGVKPDSKSQTNDESIHVGSIAAGGRCDNLVGMYGKKAIPCVGISFGVDRIFTVLKARRAEDMRTRRIDANIMAFGGKEFTGLLPQRLELASRLWDAGIRTEFAAKVKPKLPQQF